MADIRLSASIMTHPRRMESATRLSETYPELGLRIAVDPEPESPPSTLRTALRAWQMIDPDATHHLVLQDDVILCDDFRSVLLDAIATMPGHPLALFAEWGSRTAHMMRLAALRGACWAEAADTMVPAQAVVLPAALAQGFIARVTGDPDIGDDDAIVLASYLESVEAVLYVPTVSLVDHTTVPSLLGNDLVSGPRRSPCFTPGLATAQPWTSSVLAGLPVVPYLSTLEGRSVCCLRDARARAEWSMVPARDWLGDHGFPPSRLRAGFFAACDLPGFAEASEHIGQPLLYELWITMIVYGMVIGTWREASPAWLEQAIERPAPARSLPTIVVGAYRRLLPERILLDLSVQLTPLLRDGIRYGVTASRAFPASTAISG